LPGIEILARDESFTPGGAMRNAQSLEGFVHVESTLPAHLKNVLFDPQTSGGLLISVAQNCADALLRELSTRRAQGWIIGCVQEGPPRISVVG
jgi:selenide,water dikinase